MKSFVMVALRTALGKNAEAQFEPIAIGESIMPLSGAALDEPFELSALLDRGLKSAPDDAALVSARRIWTWRELDRTSRRYAANLLNLGLQPGDRVASLMPNRTALVLHYLGCMRAGLVATPLNYRYMAPEIDHALEVSEASILLAHAERDDDIAASRLASRLPLGVIGYGAHDGRSPSFEELLELDPGDVDLPRPAPSDPAVIFFTSGSTGPAKGVTHTFGTYGWMIRSHLSGYEITSEDVILPGSSLSHIGAHSLALEGLRSRRPGGRPPGSATRRPRRSSCSMSCRSMPPARSTA